MNLPRSCATFVALLILAGCASRGTVQWAPGISLAHPGSSPVDLPPARTIRAETRCILKSQGRTMRFETILVADSTRGRLEAIGPFGMNLATIIWQDSSWEVYLPSQQALVRGTGDSLTLPVVGMRTIRPRELVGPYLGRPIPARSGVPLRTIGGDDKQVVVMPVERAPKWSLILNRATGLPRRLQILRDSREAERIDFGAWKDHEGVPVPDSIVRTGAAGQELTMLLQSWRIQSSIEPGMLAFNFSKPVDTIVVEPDGAGRPRYRLLRAGGDGAAISDGMADSLLGEEPTDSTDDDPALDDASEPDSEDPVAEEPDPAASQPTVQTPRPSSPRDSTKP